MSEQHNNEETKKITPDQIADLYTPEELFAILSNQAKKREIPNKKILSEYLRLYREAQNKEKKWADIIREHSQAGLYGKFDFEAIGLTGSGFTEINLHKNPTGSYPKHCKISLLNHIYKGDKRFAYSVSVKDQQTVYLLRKNIESPDINDVLINYYFFVDRRSAPDSRGHHAKYNLGFLLSEEQAQELFEDVKDNPELVNKITHELFPFIGDRFKRIKANRMEVYNLDTSNQPFQEIPILEPIGEIDC